MYSADTNAELLKSIVPQLSTDSKISPVSLDSRVKILSFTKACLQPHTKMILVSMLNVNNSTV